MPDPIGAGLAWLRRVVAKGAEAPPAEPGEEQEISLAEALARVEAGLCDALPDPALAADDRLEEATGLALTGGRAAVFVSGGELRRALGPLHAAAERLAPLTVHVLERPGDAGEGGGPGWSAAAATGAVVLAASSPQESADLASLAHRVAEGGMQPVVLFSDGHAVETLRVPDVAAVAARLGAPGEPAPTPTEEQRDLFGLERRRVHAWFDPDHPVAAGATPTVAERRRADASRRRWLAEPLPALIEAEMKALSEATGREVRAVRRWGPRTAEIVVVASGSAVRPVRAAMEQAGRGPNIAVVAIACLRPWPRAAVAEALAGARTVAVVEPAADPLGPGGPLSQAVATTLTTAVVTAEYPPGAREPDPARLAGLCAGLRAGEFSGRVRLWDDGGEGPTDRFPRRAAVVRSGAPASGPVAPRLVDGAPATDASPSASTSAPTSVDSPGALPAIARRVSRTRRAPDSLPRFWGEVIQPARAAAAVTAPDPLTAASVVPACASALSDVGRAASPPAVLPVLDPSACTGCGDCWAACPDSAVSAAVIGIEPLLTAAAKIAGTRGPQAAALARNHKHLARRIATGLTGSERTVLDADALADAYAWLGGRVPLAGDDRALRDEAFAATADVVAGLGPIVAPALFHQAREASPGAEGLLVVAVDPRSCQGCGLCVSACEPGALEAVPRTPAVVDAARRRRSICEQLPDTSGATVAAAEAHPDLGPMRGLLLSRHCAEAQVGGADSDPGSGLRLATRLVTAAVERSAQARAVVLVAELDAAGAALDGRLRDTFSKGLAETDAATLARAAAGVERARLDLTGFAEALAGQDAIVSFDRAEVLRMAGLIAELDRARSRVAEGADGLGRARFGVVVAGSVVADELLRPPRHPWYAPAIVRPGGGGAALARGIARGLARRHVGLRLLLREAELLAKPPRDLPVRLAALGSLRWGDLTPEERASCPPLLVLADEGALVGGLGELASLLDGDLPIKVVLLDGLGRLGTGEAPALEAATRRGAFVLSASPAFPDHLGRGVADAVAFGGPALLHLHAPSPARHGFEPDRTLEQARAAVKCRAHVLFRYDPSAEGSFGERMSLDGNPGADEAGAPGSLEAWASGERRFEDTDPARLAPKRAEVWTVLRELCGIGGPFARRAQARADAELTAHAEARVATVVAGYETKLAAAARATDAEAVRRLTDRLLALAGYSAGPGPSA